MNDHDRLGPTLIRSIGSLRAWRNAATLLLAGFVLAGTASAESLGEGPDYDSFSRGVFLPYLNAERGLGGHTPSLGLSFGGRMHRATLDSGSTGVVVAAGMIPSFRDLRSLGEGTLTYTSSGRVMLGQWVVTPMTIHGADRTRARISEIPVLAVTRVRCLRQARDCEPNDAPTSIAMIGIGFGREADAQTQSTPDKNPFLHLDPEGRSYRRGYVLTARGVHVGLTGSNTRGEFRYLKLVHNDVLDDWLPIPACIRIGAQTAAACGSLLMDTGVTTMFLTVPASQASARQRSLPSGTEVSVAVGVEGDSTPLYAFRSDDGSAMAPEKIILRVGNGTPFVNTSVRFLNGYDYLYDFDGGYVAFRGLP